MESAEEVKSLQGISISEGVVSGSLSFLNFKALSGLKDSQIEALDMPQEIKLFHTALEHIRNELIFIKNNFFKDKKEEQSVAIFEAHLDILNDVLFIEIVEKYIKDGFSAQISVNMFLDYYENIILSHSKEPFFQDRLGDIKDLISRISLILQNNKLCEICCKDYEIICCEDISLFHFISTYQKGIKGYITKTVSYDSHVAILARSLKIPFISNVNIDYFKFFDKNNKVSLIAQGKFALITIGVTTNSSNSLVLSDKTSSSDICMKKIETKDGVNISIRLNVNSNAYSKFNKLMKIVGVGLLRSEFFINSRSFLFSEREQFEIYKEAIINTGDSTCTIRTFDIKKDKMDFIINVYTEEQISNKIYEALIHEENIIKIQFRAILKAGIYGNVRILLPMVSNVSKIVRIRCLIDIVERELQQEKEAYVNNISLGSMIEEVISDEKLVDIVEHSDFIAIGTNDLLNVMNKEKDFAFGDFESQGITRQFLSVIQRIVLETELKNKELSLCGEITNNTEALKSLVGVGVKNFSVSFVNFFKVVDEIEEMSFEDCKNHSKATLEQVSINC